MPQRRCGFVAREAYRVKCTAALMTATGIDVPQPELPPGLRQFWVELTDSNGNFNGREVEFLVVR